MSKYVYQGQEYSSLAEIAETYGINKGTLSTRLQNGWTLEEAIEKPIKSMSYETEYKGVVYPSIAELARTFDVGVDLLQQRLDLGWDIEKAINTPVKQIKTEVYYQGKKYESLSQLSKELDIPYNSVSHSYYKTQNIDEAVEKAYAAMTKLKPKAWDKEYDSYSKLSFEYGVRVNSLMKLINSGCSIEDAILNLLKTEKIVFNGKEYRSMAELAGEYKMQPANVYARLQYGFTLEEALTVPIRQAPGLYTKYRNKEYVSKVALCRDYGISVTCVREQLRRHNTLSFLDMFDVFVKTKEKCNIPKSVQVNMIPKLIINGRIYNRINDFAKEIGIQTQAIMSSLYRDNTDDIIDTLKTMQSKELVRYKYQGEVVQYKDLRKLISSRELKRMADDKITIPLYPTLQQFDFDDRCFDVNKIYNDFLSDAEMSVAENMDNEQYEEDSGITMGGM